VRKARPLVGYEALHGIPYCGIPDIKCNLYLACVSQIDSPETERANNDNLELLEWRS
jgi:hypothetical protein